MRILNFDKGEAEMPVVKEIFENSGVIMHPTDTCFGLAANIHDQNALEKLYAIKQMKKDKPVSIMVDSIDRALEYGDFSPLVLDVARKFLPGPLTIIVKPSELLPKFLNQGFATIGIRFPDHKLSLELIRINGGPLTTTSANISGKPEVKSVEEYMQQMQSVQYRPDLILYEEDYEPVKPSTIVDFSGDEPKILREGVLADSLREYIHNR